MPAISIDTLEWPRTHPNRWCANQMVVPVQLQFGADRDLNRVLKHLGKCLFRSPGKLIPPATAAVASRNRWRGAGHTSPMTEQLAVIMTLTLPGTGAAGPDLFGQCDVTVVGGATTPVPFHYGSQTVTGDGNTPQYHSRALFLVPALPDTAYEFLFTDNGAAGGGGGICSRLVSGEIHELMLPGHTLNGHAPMNASVLGPIYNADRSLPFGLADLAWRQQGGTCINITTDVDTEAVTRTSSTPANFADDSVTTLGAHPRFKLDMRARNRRSSSGVPMRMKAFASMTGTGVGYVRLYDSAGDLVTGAEVEVTGASPAWHEIDFGIPAVEDEYAITIQGDDVDEIEVFAVSIYELDPS